MGRPREQRRWRTHFGDWVSRMTVPRLVKAFHARGDTIHPNAVYNWLSGRTVPRIDRAETIVEISDGKISVETIYSHRRELRGANTVEPAGGHNEEPAT